MGIHHNILQKIRYIPLFKKFGIRYTFGQSIVVCMFYMTVEILAAVVGLKVSAIKGSVSIMNIIYWTICMAQMEGPKCKMGNN